MGANSIISIVKKVLIEGEKKIGRSENLDLHNLPAS